MKVYGEIINTAPIEELYDNLQQRIDKAIEYIESRHIKAGVELMPREKELLDILKGSDKDDENI